jgi:farnesyl-diphosphate farnesyltransferase
VSILFQTPSAHAPLLKLTRHWLPRVSRSFAPSIALLGEEMEAPVGLAYLLCRIVDTVEDAELPVPERQALMGRFLAGLSDKAALLTFLQEARKSGAFESGADAELLHQSAEVVRYLESLSPEAQAIFRKCIHEMGEGMALILGQPPIQNETELTRYCHIVAGTVGELLTELYCLTHAVDAHNTRALWADSASFSQGLQRVNIAKDAGQDHARKASFIPGFSVASDKAHAQHKLFCTQILPYLHGALRYTLAIAPTSPYRQFCALPLLLAAKTLGTITGHPEVFSLEGAPRIPRLDTLKLIDFCRLHAGNNAELSQAFRLATTPSGG